MIKSRRDIFLTASVNSVATQHVKPQTSVSLRSGRKIITQVGAG